MAQLSLVTVRPRSPHRACLRHTLLPELSQPHCRVSSAHLSPVLTHSAGSPE